MGVKDARRLGVVKAAVDKEITSRKGAQWLGISIRQFKRLRKRFGDRKAAGLVHGNRGRPSPRRLGEEVRQRVVALLTEVTVRVNDHHISDLLHEEGHAISPTSVRRIRRGLGVRPKHERRPRQHRRRREREACEGSMVLIDGSPHRWLGPQREERTLVGTLDDATGRWLALIFRPEEDLHGFAAVMAQTIRKFGVPAVLYGDQTTIAIRTDAHWSLEEELAGRQTPTHFGQMLEDLGIRYIAARSPEAKGRIEQKWRTLQDRLVAELALRGISTWDAAEAYLPTFIAKDQGVPPRNPISAWRPAPRDLDQTLSCRYQRTVGRDNVVSFFRAPIQIPPGPRRRSYHGRKVEIRELLDGRLRIAHQDQLLIELPAPPEPFALLPRDSDRGRRAGPRKIDLLGSPRIDDRPQVRVRGRGKKGIGTLTNVRRPSPQHAWKKSFKPAPLAATNPEGG